MTQEHNRLLGDPDNFPQPHNGLIAHPDNFPPPLSYKDACRQIMAGARLHEARISRFSVAGRHVSHAVGARLRDGLGLVMVAEDRSSGWRVADWAMPSAQH